jgi:addiction module HigA family antidote
MARSAIHPGEHLAEAIDAPLFFMIGASRRRSSRATSRFRPIACPPRREEAILHFTRAITADTALRLGRTFGTSPEFWMNLQQIYELRRAQQELGDDIKSIPRGKARAA